jgi:uncharacterized protein (DUF433 family)
MTSSSDSLPQKIEQQSIVSNTIDRNETGLFISGTRISLYDIMDFEIAQYPAKFIANMLNLSQEQVQTALEYINTHRTEVEAEYQSVLTEAAELQAYWQEQNRELNDRVAKLPAPAGQEAAWKKLQAQKAKKLVSKQ